MKFTAACVIHASNPKIWRRLMNYGLHPNTCSPNLTVRTDSNRMCTVVECGSFFNVKESNLADYVYDCKDDEDLFFALAPMREDSDINQWFIYDNRSWNDNKPQRYWFVCKQEKIEDDMFLEQMYEDCEKATKEEIIAHFNGWDDDPEVLNQQ